MGPTCSLKYYWATSFYCTAIHPTPFFLTSPYYGCKQEKNGARKGKRVHEARFFGMPILLVHKDLARVARSMVSANQR